MEPTEQMEHVEASGQDDPTLSIEYEYLMQNCNNRCKIKFNEDDEFIDEEEVSMFDTKIFSTLETARNGPEKLAFRGQRFIWAQLKTLDKDDILLCPAHVFQNRGSANLKFSVISMWTLLMFLFFQLIRLRFYNVPVS